MRIFISYSRHNRDVADAIANDLRARGADVFIDYQRLSAGDSFPDRLREEITACDAFVLLMSAQSAESQWVQDEEMLARTLEKPIIPVKVDDLDIVRSPFWRCLRLNWVLWDGDAVGAALGRIGSALGLEYIDTRAGALRQIASAFELGEAASVGGGQALPRATQASPLQDTWERLPFEPETVLVPAGPFLMGSTAEHVAQLRAQGFDWPEESEQPQHTLTLPDYHIGKYPVTVGEFRAFVEGGGYMEQRFWTEVGWRCRENNNWTAPRYWDEEKWIGDDRLPVVGVSWYETAAYVQWLREATRRDYRLPIEAEWEKAARGTDGRIYPWGNEWRDGVCNTSKARIERTSPVGKYSPHGDSPYEAVDMIGNVSEWCVSKWRDNYSMPEDNELAGMESRCLRGGSWARGTQQARCASRFKSTPDYGSSLGSFRVCAGVSAVS